MSKINATTALDTFRLDTATHRDAPRIAEIHMAAFGPNAMLHAQFPTPAIRQQLQICITEKAFADIDDPKTTVLVVTNSEGISDSRFVTFISATFLRARLTTLYR